MGSELTVAALSFPATGSADEAGQILEKRASHSNVRGSRVGDSDIATGSWRGELPHRRPPIVPDLVLYVPIHEVQAYSP